MELAADANVLLSAVIGGRAKLILNHPEIQAVLTTESTLSEVQEYALLLARKKRLPSDIVLLAVAALPVEVVTHATYSRQIPEALRQIGKRDPDDAELLALALHFQIPVWSNDHDFENLTVELFTTADLLRQLAVIK